MKATIQRWCPGWVALAAVLCLGQGGQAALNDGLVLHYPFDEDPVAGSPVLDQSAAHNDGKVNGNPRRVKGRWDGAWSFDGENDYVTCMEDASLNVGTRFTASVWFNASTYGVQRPLLEWCRSTAVPGSDFGVHVWCNVHGKHGWYGTGASLVTSWGADDAHVISHPDLPPQQWHHLAVTYSRSTGEARLYLDGTNVSVEAFGEIYPLTAADFHVGCRPSVSWARWHGLLDDVRVYNRVLDEEEILALFNGPPASEGAVISSIGFSSQPDGDQDVTTFYTDETLHVRVGDVDCSGPNGPRFLRVLTRQGAKILTWKLVRQADGFYTGSIPLNRFLPGIVWVQVDGIHDGVGLFKETSIVLLEPTGKPAN